jgi:hypothetical protein
MVVKYVSIAILALLSSSIQVHASTNNEHQGEQKLVTHGKDIFLEEADSVNQSLFDYTGPKHPTTGLPGHYMRPIHSSKLVKVPIRELNRHYIAKFTVNNIEYDLSMTSHSNHIGIFD